MVKQKILAVVAGVFLLLPFNVWAQSAPVEKTGQTTSYRTGDDGDYEAGVAWPVPRFTDNGDGTVTDNLTGLMWAQDANLFGQRTWNDALADCNSLELGQNGCKLYSDWRLPNAKELHSLVDLGNYLPSLPSDHPFTNVQSNQYWSSTTSKHDFPQAWFVGMYYGDSIYPFWKDASGSVWPVRGETSGPAPVEKTGQTTSYATGDDGDYEAGVAWPVPRFTDNGDGTVTDNLTGLMWTQNAQEISGRKTWADAIAACRVLVLPICGGYSDWRLPNAKELRSLIDWGNWNPALPSGHPFTNVQSGYYYWSSTTSKYDFSQAWYVSIGTGSSFSFWKGVDYFVWPVRGPN